MPIGAVHMPVVIETVEATETAQATAPGATAEIVRHQPIIEICLAELLSIEARLAHRVVLGVARPSDARRLDCIAAEIDRRWDIALHA